MALVPLRTTLISCSPGLKSHWRMPSSSAALAPVEIQNATRARSRSEGSGREQLVEPSRRGSPAESASATVGR